MSEIYKVPFKFTGTLNKVVISLDEAKLSAEDQKATEEPAEQARGGFRLICHTFLYAVRRMVQEGASGSRGLCCDKVLIVDRDTPDAGRG